jgi:hypothetical protein
MPTAALKTKPFIATQVQQQQQQQQQGQGQRSSYGSSRGRRSHASGSSTSMRVAVKRGVRGGGRSSGKSSKSCQRQCCCCSQDMAPAAALKQLDAGPVAASPVAPSHAAPDVVAAAQAVGLAARVQQLQQHPPLLFPLLQTQLAAPSRHANPLTLPPPTCTPSARPHSTPRALLKRYPQPPRTCCSTTCGPSRCAAQTQQQQSAPRKWTSLNSTKSMDGDTLGVRFWVQLLVAALCGRLACA